jgi:hypothetical protein
VRGLWFVLLAFGLIVLVLVMWRAGGGPTTALAPPGAADPAQEPGGDALVSASTAGAAADEPQRAPAAQPAAKTGGPPSPPPDALAELRGRFLLPGGAPAAGVALKVNGWEANDERVVQFGRPKAWSNPTGTSGPDGRFALRFDPPRAYQFTLAATLAGHADTSWRWSEIAPGSTVDLGDVQLFAGGTVRARVVDSAGRTLVQGWRIYAEGGVPGGRESARQQTGVSDVPDAASGTALLTGLPPGPVKLTAHSDLANWIDGPVVDVRAGETVEA